MSESVIPSLLQILRSAIVIIDIAVSTIVMTMKMFICRFKVSFVDLPIDSGAWQCKELLLEVTVGWRCSSAHNSA